MHHFFSLFLSIFFTSWISATDIGIDMKGEKKTNRVLIRHTVITQVHLKNHVLIKGD